MGEVIMLISPQRTAMEHRHAAEAERQRAADARAARQRAVLEAKRDRLSREDRRKLARNLGRLVEDVAQATGQPAQQIMRELFEKHDQKLLAKRRRIILLKGELPPRGAEAFVAYLPVYHSLAGLLAESHPRSGLDRAGFKRRYQERLVAGTSLSIDAEFCGAPVDADAIGGLIDLLGDAMKLLKARVPRLIEHFEMLANSRLSPSIKSLDFSGDVPPHLTPIQSWRPVVDDGSDGCEDGILTLTGFDEGYILTEDEFEIEHHWPSTKLGTIVISKAVSALDESDSNLASIAAAFRSHPDWEVQSSADTVDLEGQQYGEKAVWLDANGHGHFIDGGQFHEQLRALSRALDQQTANSARPLVGRLLIERRFSLHLCVYPFRARGKTDCHFGLYLTEAKAPALHRLEGGGPLFDTSLFADPDQNVALACLGTRDFIAIRASDVRALDEQLDIQALWSRGDWFPTHVAPLASSMAAKWLGGRTLDWAMSNSPRSDRFREGPVLVLEPAFAVHTDPASAPLATPAGMIERSILHDTSGNDVLSRVIEDAEARVAWLDELQSSWAAMHRQARTAYAAEVEAISNGADWIQQSDG